MDRYIREVQLRLRQKKIGYKKEFLREILKEVRVRGSEVRLTYKLPMTVRTPLSQEANPEKEEFFTLYQMVEPMGVEPTASRVRFRFNAKRLVQRNPASPSNPKLLNGYFSVLTINLDARLVIVCFCSRTVPAQGYEGSLEALLDYTAGREPVI